MERGFVGLGLVSAPSYPARWDITPTTGILYSVAVSPPSVDESATLGPTLEGRGILQPASPIGRVDLTGWSVTDLRDPARSSVSL